MAGHLATRCAVLHLQKFKYHVQRLPRERQKVLGYFKGRFGSVHYEALKCLLSGKKIDCKDLCSRMICLKENGINLNAQQLE